MEPERASVDYKKRGSWLRIFGDAAAESSVPVRNISRVGICFMCGRRLRSGQQLEMVVNFPREGESIPVSGQVMWAGPGNGQQPYRVGVRFGGLSGEAEQKLMAFLGNGQERRKIARVNIDSEYRGSRAMIAALRRQPNVGRTVDG